MVSKFPLYKVIVDGLKALALPAKVPAYTPLVIGRVEVIEEGKDPVS